MTLVDWRSYQEAAFWTTCQYISTCFVDNLLFVYHPVLRRFIKHSVIVILKFESLIVFTHGKNLTLARIQVDKVSIKVTVDLHPPPDLRPICLSALQFPNDTQRALHSKIVACRVLPDTCSHTEVFVH